MQKRIVTLKKKKKKKPENDYFSQNNFGQHHLSLKMMVGSLISCSSLSFGLGRWMRSSIIQMMMNKSDDGPLGDDTSNRRSKKSIDNNKDTNAADSSCMSSYSRHSYQPPHPNNNDDNAPASFLDDINNVQESSYSSSLSYHPPPPPRPTLEHHRMMNPRQRRHIMMVEDEMNDKQESILYHEALIHPAMLTHPNPRRVLLLVLVSSDEDDDLTVAIHQVFQHNTVQHVTVLIPPQNNTDISDNEGSSSRSSRRFVDGTDDDRVVEIIQANAVDWVMHRFSPQELLLDESLAEKYDVIVLDSTSRRHPDKSTTPMFSRVDTTQGGDAVFAKALGNALTNQGILVAYAGPMDKGRDAALDLNPKHRRERVAMTRALEHLGGELKILEAVKIYTQSSFSRRRPRRSPWHVGGWTFMVAFRDYSTLTRWFSNQAEIDLQLEARKALSTLAKTSAYADGATFRYFDGATMELYQYPSRIVQDVFCRTTAISPVTPDLCAKGHGFDPNVPNAPISSFEVRPSTIEGAGRGIFLKESVQKGTYIAIDHGVHSIYVMPRTSDIVTEMQDQADSSEGVGSYGDLWNPFLYYMHGYGFESDYFGDDGTVVDSGILTFANHGCNGTYNMGQTLSSHEMSAPDASGNHQPPLELLQDEKHTIYDVFYDRSHWIYESASDIMRIDVVAGSELLDNYLPFYVDWEEGVTDLRSQCQGQTVGLVTAYETAESSSRL